MKLVEIKSKAKSSRYSKGSVLLGTDATAGQVDVSNPIGRAIISEAS